MITASPVRGAAGAEYYCSGVEAPSPVTSYYTDSVASGEPAGRWSGAGAEALGLVGEVDDDALRSVVGEYLTPDGRPIGRRPRQLSSASRRVREALAAEPDASPERRAEILAGRERSDGTVTGYDATFSVPKSVSAAWAAAQRAEVDTARAGDVEGAARHRARREAIERAVEAGSAGAIEYLAARSMSRVGRHGGAGSDGRWIRAGGLVTASFRQHTNRNLDPQLHVHNVILNRVLCEDGEWRACDFKDLLTHQHASGAVGQAIMREALAAEGLDCWSRRPDGVELDVVPDRVRNALSSRRRGIEEALRPLVAEVEEVKGRPLSDREIWHLRHQLWSRTRAGKDDVHETAEEMSDRLDATLRAEGASSMRAVSSAIDAHLSAGRRAPVAEWSEDAVISAAIAECGEESSTFTESALTAAIMRQLPPVLGCGPERVAEMADRLTARALVHEDLVHVAGRGDDRERSCDRRFAAAGTLVAEEALRRAAVTRGAHCVDVEAVAAWLDEHAPTIGADQRAAVEGIASSDAALTVLVGPAGAGKSYAMGAFADAWQGLSGGRMFGLAVSQVAADVLADDGLTDSANIARWLAAQDRLDAGSTADARWALGARDVVLVDEASMVTTADLTAIRERVEAAGARLVLAGDPRQLAAVGAGGSMDLLDGHAETYSLSDIRRFRARWEARASLALRDGDVSALATYDRRGRVLGYGSRDLALDSIAQAVTADLVDGQTVTAVAVRSADAAEIALRVRDRLIALGRVDAGRSVTLGRDGCQGSVGDRIMARRNDRTIGVTNRAVYRIERVADDGSVTVVDERSGRILDVPAAYVEANAQLAYGSTVHAAQGLTVDRAHLFTDGAGDASATYVGMTRGRHSNTAHVVTGSTAAPGVEVDRQRIVSTSSAVEVLARTMEPERVDDGRSALVTAEADQEAQASMVRTLGDVEATTRAACRARLDRHLDGLVADGVLSEGQRARLCADQGVDGLSRALRAVEQTSADPQAVLREAVESGTLDGARALAPVLTARVADVTGWRALAVEDVPPADIDEVAAGRLRDLASQADARRRDLGERLAAAPEPWALDTLGPVPEVDDPRRAEWVRRAGAVAGHREAVGWNHQHRVLPPPPGVHSTELRVGYMRAWEAAGRPAHTRTCAMFSDGQVIVRAKAAEDARAWEPRDAAADLRRAHLDAERARQDAALARAEGDLTRARVAAQRAQDAERAAEMFAAEVEDHDEWAQAVAATLLEGDAAAVEAESRGLLIGDEPDRATASQWLAVDQDARAADDAHRIATEVDLHDDADDDLVVPEDLDQLPEVTGSLVDAACRAAVMRSQDADVPDDDSVRRRWVLDTMTTDDTADQDTDCYAA